MATLFTSESGVRGGIVWKKAVDMEVMAPGTTTMNGYIDMMLAETPSSLDEERSKKAIVGACKVRHCSVFSEVDR